MIKILLAVIVAAMPITSAAAGEFTALQELREMTAGAEAPMAGPQAVTPEPSPAPSCKAGASRRRLMDKKLIYVLDGDTLSYGRQGAKKLDIRILGIDTPETKHYGAGKFEDQEFGPEATKAGRAIISRAKKIEYMSVGLDKYGRTLAHIFVDNELYAVKILEKGLAYETISAFGDNGFPDLAAAILQAARTHARKDFERPCDWRARVWSEEKERAELRKDLALKKISMDKSLIGFDDGDTVFYNGITLRILGIDTPETIHEEQGIYKNQPYGRKSSALTKKLISNARAVEYLAGPKDLYGRTLAHVFIDGELLAVMQVRAGLAYEDVSKFGATGFPGYARMILNESRLMPTPPFENPFYWRVKNQHRPDKYAPPAEEEGLMLTFSESAAIGY